PPLAGKQEKHMEILYQNLNRLENAGIRHALLRGTCDVLEHSEQGIFLYERVGRAHMLATDEPALGIEWLRAHDAEKFRLIAVNQPQIADWLGEKMPASRQMRCYTAAYQQPEPPAPAGELHIRKAGLSDLPLVLSHYDLVDEDELREGLRRGNLIIGQEEDTPVGFIGEHLESGMGMLTVFPAFRRRGYAQILEAHLIARILARGQQPYCHIEERNAPSLALQRKLGLDISERLVYWVF
ncbi:MAG: GNAT family N-acetyltransferase, partial [Clostridia bacterium]|nr:GNAT family N-acetyltransferase [Clostridia bacterium]